MALTWRFADRVGANTGGETSHTFTSVPLGTAASDRWVYVAVIPATNTATAISSVTVGGVSMTAAAGNLSGIGATSERVFFYKLNVTSGTSANVVVSYSGGGVWSCAISVWTDNGEPTEFDQALTSTVSSNAMSVALDIPADGKVIAAAMRLNMTSAAWSGLTERYDDNTDVLTAASDEGLSSETGRTITATFTGGFNFESSLGALSFSTGGGGPSPVTGTLAATEGGADTASLAGDVIVRGALAASETGADTAAISGDVPIAGALAAVESGADVAAMSGDVLVQGSLAATEAGSDVAAFAGAGSLPAIIGAMAAGESGADTAALAGLVRVSGALAATEAGQDVAAASGKVLVSGALAASEAGSDAASFVGSGALPAIVGSMAATEDGPDVAAFTGRVPVVGTLAATDAADTAALSGRVIIAGILAAIESGQDVAAFRAPAKPGRIAYPVESQSGGTLTASDRGGSVLNPSNGGILIRG